MNSTTFNLELYKKLYLIRRAEEEIRKRYPEDEMKTPIHLSIGGEAIAVGVCHALRPEDQVLSSYRSHAVYLSKTQETDKFFGELYGKVTGMARGKAGSMHLSSIPHGYFGASAIVASTIPVAVGIAFANKRAKNRRIAAVFFGDGAIDEGVFWESLNIACLMKLPILFVCEDNDLAIHTRAAERHGYRSITGIVSRFHCNVFQSKTTDVEKIHELTKKAIISLQRNSMPCFLHLRYYRYFEHVGVGEDFEAGYRSRKEFKKWFKQDPVALQRRKLLKQGIHKSKIFTLEEAINQQVERSVEYARNAKSPRPEELRQDVYG